MAGAAKRHLLGRVTQRHRTCVDERAWRLALGLDSGGARSQFRSAAPGGRYEGMDASDPFECDDQPLFAAQRREPDDAAASGRSLRNVPNRMDTNERHARMWVDLFQRETDRVRAEFSVIEAALIYLDLGLPLAQVLDALKLTEPEWLARVARHADRRADNRAIATRLLANYRPQGDDDQPA